MRVNRTILSWVLACSIHPLGRAAALARPAISSGGRGVASRLTGALAMCLVLAGVAAGCTTAPTTPTARPTLVPPTATPTVELSWQVDKVLRASAIPSKTKFYTPEPDRVYLVIQATVRNISGKRQTIYDSRTHVRVLKTGSSDWTVIAIDGPATGAASDTFGLKALNAGFLGVTLPVLEPEQTEHFAIAYSLPTGSASLQFAPQGMPPFDLTPDWGAAEAFAPPTPTATPTATPTPTITPIPPTGTPTATGTPLPLLKVVQVIDGDSFKVDLGGGQQDTVSMIGIEAPSVGGQGTTVQCFSKEALAKARELLNGKKVRLLIDSTQVLRDKEDRAFRYVEREDGLDVGLELIKGGYVPENTYYVPYQRKPAYVAAQEAADTAGLGLWAAMTCNGDTTQAATPTPKPSPTPTRTPTATPTQTATPKPSPTKAPTATKTP